MEDKQAALKKLTPTQFAVTQEAATERPSPGTMIFMKRGLYVDVVSGNRSSRLRISMTPAAVGRPLLNRSRSS